MMKRKNAFIAFILVIVTFFLWQPHGGAMEVTDKFAISGILAGAYQYQDVSDASGLENTGRGGLAFQRHPDHHRSQGAILPGAGKARGDGHRLR